MLRRHITLIPNFNIFGAHCKVVVTAVDLLLRRHALNREPIPGVDGLIGALAIYSCAHADVHMRAPASHFNNSSPRCMHALRIPYQSAMDWATTDIKISCRMMVLTYEVRAHTRA